MTTATTLVFDNDNSIEQPHGDAALIERLSVPVLSWLIVATALCRCLAVPVHGVDGDVIA